MASTAPSSSTATADVLVVGGGPAGLTAALLAARAGRSVVLVEASSALGGMSRSITIGGQRVDLGSHRLHPAASPRVRQLLDGLLGDDLQVRPRRGRLRLGDRWVAFPLRPGDLAKSLPPATAAGIATDLLSGGPGEGERPQSYADVVRARLGATVLEHFHGPYAEKLYGVSPEEIDGSVARRRIATRGMGGVLARLARGARPSGRRFLYPRLGYGQIVDRLAEAATAAGAELRTHTRPTRIHPCPSPRVELSGRDGPAEEVRVGRVLWTAPPDALAAATGLPGTGLRHRGVALVYLAVASSRYLQWDAHYVPDPDVAFVRLSEPKNYRDGPDPDGVTVLCAEVPCALGDQVWNTAPTDLAKVVQRGMGRLGLPMAPVEAHQVRRLPRVYPLVRLGEADGLRAALERLERVEGVTLLGRQGLALADNLHHVIDMAIAATDALGPDGAWDEAAWTAARRGFEDHVIED